MNNATLIRDQFINYFKDRKHIFVPSAPVVPGDDPTLLFTNAGMNQFKDVFLEQGSRIYSRAVNSQKCIRVSGKHNDLEEVGHSPSHHTFFEMLGNWSFGDYYKQEAIKWAWDLMTNVWKLEPNRLYATVFKGDDFVPADDEAVQAWKGETNIAHDHISYHGKKENFWEMGEIGPCGPCSELHYDLGPQFCELQGTPNHVCTANGDCGRVVELWNLVFIQLHRDSSGALHPLPRKHVDTGAGFERVVRVLEGVDSNYENSLFKPIIDEIVRLSGVPYRKDKLGVPHRVAADHVRAIAFSIADGVLPSNDGRGYVIRRILRRASRFGREIGLETPFLFKLVDPLTEMMGDTYPELKQRNQHIVGVVKAEEESFSRTLGRGLEIFSEILEKESSRKSKIIKGDDAFKLYDTFGFPLDLTQLMARERNLSVDTDRFNELMSQQRERARGEEKFATTESIVASGAKSEFVGYSLRNVSATVSRIAQKGESVEIVLDSTPFYAESGGQLSDKGYIRSSNGLLEVQAVYKRGDTIVHIGIWKGDSLPAEGQSVTAEIDWNYRLPIMYNHTATHLLHKALHSHLGEHAKQAGSLVAPDRLRFDFTHFERVTEDQLHRIENTVNEVIREDFPVQWFEKSYQAALADGVTALFGEKYGDVVRVVQVGPESEPYSRELCGGTHVQRTGQIGIFRIISESAVSAGVRRIEAVTGPAALQLTQKEHSTLEQIMDLLGSRGSDPVEKLSKTIAEKKALEKEFEEMLLLWAKNLATELLLTGHECDGITIVLKLFDGVDIERVKLVGDAIRSLNSNSVALLGTKLTSESGQLCCVVGDTLIAKGKLKAGQLVGSAAKLAGGGGGGKPHMATAGTRFPDRLIESLNGFEKIVQDTIK